MNTWPFSKISKASIAVSLLVASLTPLPAVANPAVNCVDDLCTVTFNFVGAVQSFSIPSNAKNLGFEAFGAQGGKSGGGGGKVSGVFTSIPETIYVAVGGAGSTGAFAAGGFNGGGTAGSGSGMEGSGGGATDIRLSPDLSSRVVVAGGGGGRGAGLGSGGGAGGGLTGADGKSGQGFGGKGATQTSAGLGGAKNGSGTSGGTGLLHVGGSGGSSSLYGGGGGGGGYFGGGGGGSDTNSCCNDAGGGGGGSSFTNQNLISGVVHTQGAHPGNGQLILTYTMVPSVVSFGSQVSLTNQASIDFQLEFNQSVVGLTESDFTLIHSYGSCDEIVLSGSGASYTLQLSNCDDGQLQLSLSENAVSNTQASGPSQSITSNSVLIDTKSPFVSWLETTPEIARMQFSEAIQGLQALDLVLQSDSGNCQIASINQISNMVFEIGISQCLETSFQLQLLAQSVQDSVGNLGPATASVTSFSYAPEPEAAPTPDPEPTSEPSPVPTAEPSPEPETPEPSVSQSPALENVSDESTPQSQAQPTSPSPEPTKDAGPAEPSASTEVVQAPESTASTHVEQDLVSQPEATDTSNELISEGVQAENQGESPVDTESTPDQILNVETAKPRQSAARLIGPTEQVSETWSLGPIAGSLVILAIFGLIAGLVISRRIIPASLLS